MGQMTTAEDRATAGRLANVRKVTSTTVATVTLQPGWWALQAYDAEVYVLTGDKSANWSDATAWRQDPMTEPIGIYIPNDDLSVTYRCASGGHALFARRSLR